MLSEGGAPKNTLKDKSLEEVSRLGGLGILTLPPEFAWIWTLSCNWLIQADEERSRVGGWGERREITGYAEKKDAYWLKFEDDQDQKMEVPRNSERQRVMQPSISHSSI